jgi:D-alanyl-D-alanine dipeptidase
VLKVVINKFNLKSEIFELFMAVHAKHLAAWGTEARKKRTLEHITKVVWDQEEDCLKVYYDDGEWWHYTKRHEWY